MEWFKALESKVKAIRSAPKELQYEGEERLAKDRARDEAAKRKRLTYSAVDRNKKTARVVAGLED